MIFRLSGFFKYFFVFFILIVIYLYTFIISDSYPSIYDVLVFGVALFFLFTSFYTFGHHKYDLAPIFNMSFFSVLLFSCYQISRLQTSYDFDFAFIIIIGGSVFSCFLLLIDKLNFRSLKSKLAFKPSNIIKIMLILYISLKVIIIFKNGVRLEALLGGVRHSGDDYVVPGLSGLAAIFQWSLLIAFPLISKKLKLSIILSIFIFALLSAKRGDVVRMLIYLTIYYFIFKDKYLKLSNIKIKILTIVLFVLFICLFSYTGNARQHAYDKNFSIVELLDSYYDNEALAWFFSYTGLNFEVLSRLSLNNNDYFPMNVLSLFPIGMIPKDKVLEYYDKISSNRVAGFNASTFLGPMVFDMGEYFWIELLMFNFTLFVLIFFAKLSGSVGSILFIMSLLVLLPFGNYILSAQFYFAVLFSSVLNVFMKNKE